MTTLFFGTSEFAVPSLRAVASRSQLAGAVTQPDRPSGRGHRMTPSPVKSAAAALGIPIFEPVDLRAFAREITSRPVDLFVLASYGRILPQALLDLPRLGALNVHPSLLPKYRGATPIQSAIACGERETGVTIMLMDAGLDTGDVVVQERIAISPGETYGELHDRLAEAGAGLVSAVLDRASQGALTPTPQCGEPTLTRPLAKADLIVDLGWPVERIVNAVRALSPRPGARAMMEGEMVKVLSAHAGEKGELVIDALIPPNRGAMSGAEYARLRGSLR